LPATSYEFLNGRSKQDISTSGDHTKQTGVYTVKKVPCHPRIFLKIFLDTFPATQPHPNTDIVDSGRGGSGGSKTKKKYKIVDFLFYGK